MLPTAFLGYNPNLEKVYFVIWSPTTKESVKYWNKYKSSE